MKDFLAKFESVASAASFLSAFETFICHFSSDYLKDGNLQDALIDEAIEYLQSLKGKKNG